MEASATHAKLDPCGMTWILQTRGWGGGHGALAVFLTVSVVGWVVFRCSRGAKGPKLAPRRRRCHLDAATIGAILSRNFQGRIDRVFIIRLMEAKLGLVGLLHCWNLEFFKALKSYCQKKAMAKGGKGKEALSNEQHQNLPSEIVHL